MAGNNTVSSSLPSREYSCKICDLSLDSKDSLDVHLQYHKENLYVKWAAHSNQNDSSENDSPRIKTETPVSAPADSSDNMITKPSPDFQQRSTPETSAQFQHPATPQSYHSAPSPYQNPDQTNFSPNPQFSSPQFPQTSFQQNNQGELQWDHNQYHPEYHKPGRFHPYNMQERVPQVSSSSPLYTQPLNQPTPSPSPNQCDKCGYVCDSAIQLTEHCNNAHSTNGQSHYHQMPAYNAKNYQNYSAKIKEEQDDSPDILDLDSQKVVYQGTEADNGSFDRGISRDGNHRLPATSPWSEQKVYNSSNPLNGDSNAYKDHKMFNDQKSFSNDQKFYADKNFVSSQHDHTQKVFIHHDQKIYPGVQIPLSDPYANPVVSTNPENMKPPYRPFDSPTTPQITSTQQANPTSSAIPPIGGKGANWKSNEARRPKTYNCTACNKWFTSSGHLKRHYNTTLHKNAVRSSGQPDPATMPISAHHHPTREQMHSRVHQSAPDSNTQSPVSADDSREDPVQSSYTPQGYDRSRVSAMNSKSPYSHLQQGNLDNSFVNSPLGNPSMPHQGVSHPLNPSSQPPDIHSQINKSNSSTSSPPNGEAGPSVTQNHHLRGLLSISSNNISTPVLTTTTPQITPHTLPPFSHLAVNPYSQRPTDPSLITVQEPAPTHLYLGQNFQETITANYPNGMAPHVMDMAINNLHIANPAIIGESPLPEAGMLEVDTSTSSLGGRLPSFAHIQCQIGVILPNYIKTHNVGGYNPNEDSALNPYYYVEGNSNNLTYTDTSFAEPQPDFDNQLVLKSIKIETDQEDFMRIDDIIDNYANKENYESELQSPASPESAKVEYECNGSPSVSSTVVCPPLTENNQPVIKPTIHKCYECDKVFNRACYLTQHNKSFHSGAKPFKCDRCGKRFPDDTSYEEHFMKHSGNKPFKCPQCPKSFNHKTDLRRHMCLHSGTKPYVCTTCGKGFIRKDHMVKHCDTHRKKPSRQSSTA